MKFVHNVDFEISIGSLLKTSHCICKDCDYTKPVIEGNQEFADEIHENYMKQR